MENQRIQISFDSAFSFRDRQLLAQELSLYLERGSSTSTELIRERLNTQDAGTIVGLIMASPSVVAVSKGLMNWLLKNKEVKLTLKKGDTEVRIQNISMNDLDTVVKGFESLLNNNG